MGFWTKKDEKKPETTTKTPETAAPAAKPAAPSGPLFCSFCKKSQRDVIRLIAGPEVYICNECIALCNDVLSSENAPAAIPNMSDLAASLEKEVIGQSLACRTVAAAYAQHRHHLQAEIAEHPTRVLLVGPHGCGKSTLLRALGRHAALPSYHADASRMSETGYIGENVENLVGALLDRAKDAAAAGRGLLMLDGLQHLVRQTPIPIARDVAGREVQRDLVRLLDGMEIAAIRHGRRHPQGGVEPVVCDRMMILAAASFETRALEEGELREELAEKGLVDEMLARFDIILPMRRLTAPQLSQIAERMLVPIQTLVKSLGGSIEVEDGLDVLGERAALSSSGAFALQVGLSRLRERALLEGPKIWKLDRKLAEELGQVRR